MGNAESPGSDSASELAQDVANMLGSSYGDVDSAIVILVHVEADGKRLYRLGAYVPNLGVVHQTLTEVLRDMDAPGTVIEDRREYKPEKDGQ